jgi:hypothetical protein
LQTLLFSLVPKNFGRELVLKTFSIPSFAKKPCPLCQLRGLEKKNLSGPREQMRKVLFPLLLLKSLHIKDRVWNAPQRGKAMLGRQAFGKFVGLNPSSANACRLF